MQGQHKWLMVNVVQSTFHLSLHTKSCSSLHGSSPIIVTHCTAYANMFLMEHDKVYSLHDRGVPRYESQFFRCLPVCFCASGGLSEAAVHRAGGSSPLSIPTRVGRQDTIVCWLSGQQLLKSVREILAVVTSLQSGLGRLALVPLTSGIKLPLCPSSCQGSQLLRHS